MVVFWRKWGEKRRYQVTSSPLISGKIAFYSSYTPDLARRTEKGELPVLGWKGGVDKKIKKGEKYGTLFYLAQWQGIRGDDLDIDLSDEPERVCSRTGVKVIFTNDLAKYGST